MATTNISCEADRQYVETLGMLAKKHRVSMGRLVRQAIDAKYGPELTDIEKRMTLLFGDNCASEFNTETERANA